MVTSLQHVQIALLYSCYDACANLAATGTKVWPRSTIFLLLSLSDLLMVAGAVMPTRHPAATHGLMWGPMSWGQIMALLSVSRVFADADFKSPGEAAAAKARNPWLQGACESPAGYDLGNNFLPQSNPLKPEFWETDIKLSKCLHDQHVNVQS